MNEERMGNKKLTDQKEEIKSSLLADDVIFYIQNPRESTPKKSKILPWAEKYVQQSHKTEGKHI